MDAHDLNHYASARLLLDEPAPGAWNMALDEALLRSADLSNQLTLRIYRWNEPTVSLGYFQSHEQRQEHAASVTCPMVRRATGGGAIIHDREITYSLTAPVADRLDRQIEAWYDLMHQAYVTSLNALSVHATLCPQTEPTRDQAFLCFQRRTAGDLLLGKWKIGGSAQRRHRAAVLQHGSLLMGQSPAAPELPGIFELSGVDVSSTPFLVDWIAEVGRRLGVQWVPGELNGQERALAEQLVSEKFNTLNWTLRR